MAVPFCHAWQPAGADAVAPAPAKGPRPAGPNAPAQVVGSVLPCVRELATDGSQYVRSALAGVVMELAPMLGKVREGILSLNLTRWESR